LSRCVVMKIILALSLHYEQAKTQRRQKTTPPLTTGRPLHDHLEDSAFGQHGPCARRRRRERGGHHRLLRIHVAERVQPGDLRGGSGSGGRARLRHRDPRRPVRRGRAIQPDRGRAGLGPLRRHDRGAQRFRRDRGCLRTGRGRGHPGSGPSCSRWARTSTRSILRSTASP
jgi:hypothetical protein